MKHIKQAAVFVIFTLIAAGIMGLVYTITEEPINNERIRSQAAAIEALLPEAYINEYEYIEDESTLTRLARSFDIHGELIGYVFSASPRGYAANIDLMIAIDISGVIKGIKIIRHQETPGLGSNITQEWFTNQFIDRAGVLRGVRILTTEPDEILFIASATISVEAVLHGVNDAVLFFEYLQRSE